MNSRNHHMWSSVSSYIVEKVAGLAHEFVGGVSTLTMAPASSSMSAASASLDLENGLASLSWRRHGGVQCFTASEGQALTLDCGAEGGVISSIDFASYGTPEGMCGAYERNERCHSQASAPAVATSCVGKQSCSIKINAATFEQLTCAPRAHSHRLHLQLRCSVTEPSLEVKTSVPAGSAASVRLPKRLFGASHDLQQTVIEVSGDQAFHFE